jgi:hypothetical protein
LLDEQSLLVASKDLKLAYGSCLRLIKISCELRSFLWEVLVLVSSLLFLEVRRILLSFGAIEVVELGHQPWLDVRVVISSEQLLGWSRKSVLKVWRNCAHSRRRYAREEI